MVKMKLMNFFIEMGRRLSQIYPVRNNDTLWKRFGFIAKGHHRSDWLPKLVSQSVLLWDGMKIKMERIVKDQIKITPLLQIVNFKKQGIINCKINPHGVKVCCVTDQVTEFGGSTKRVFRRCVMAEKLEDRFKRVRSIAKQRAFENWT